MLHITVKDTHVVGLPICNSKGFIPNIINTNQKHVNENKL